MKKKIEIIGFLCLAFGAINIKAQEVENLGWLNNVGGTYTYTDTANWNNGEINGVFGTNMTGKATQTIKLDNGFDLGFLKFYHSGEVTFNFVGNGGNYTTFMTNDWIQTPSTSKGVVNIGSNKDGEKLNVNLGGNDIKLKISGPPVKFYGEILNGNINVFDSTIGFKETGTFVDGTLTVSNAWVVLGSENDQSTPEVRLNKLVSYGSELTVWGHKYGNPVNERVNTFVAKTKPEGGCSTIKFYPRAKSPILHIGKLERENNSILSLNNNNTYYVGTTDFAANNCHLFFDEVPMFPSVGEVGTTTCPMYPWLVYFHDLFYTYDETRGVRPLNLETEVRTYSTNYVGELEAQGENIRITNSAAVCDFTGAENVVNSIIWAANSGGKLYATNGVLKVLSGGILMNCLDNCHLDANIDFGDVTGFFIGRNDKSNYFDGNIAGNKGVVFSTTNNGRGVNGGLFYITGTGTFTNDVYIATAVSIQNSNFFPHGDRLGNTIVDGHLRLWFNTITLNGLYGSGMVTFNNSDSSRLIVGDNDSDGDFKGRIYADNRNLNFEKIGKGTQIIRGGNSSNSGTTVTDGALYYHGPVKSKVTVAADATLGGNGTFNATGTAIDLKSGATLIPMSYEGTGSMTVANDISFGGANTLKLTAIPDATTPALNVGGSVIGADSEVDVVFEGEKPGIYTLVKAQTAIEPKFVSATPNFKVYTSEDGLTVYGEKLDMGTVVIIR